MQVGNSEDVQVGIWVDNQAKKNDQTIVYEYNKILAISIDQLGGAAEMISHVQAETTQNFGCKVNCGNMC